MNTPPEDINKKGSGSELGWGTILAITVALSISRACDSGSQPQTQSAKPVVTVFIPFPSGGRLIPHSRVVILKQKPGYIKFRTADGRIIEHSGQYQVQTSKP